ncbi:hypothetical protein [Parapedobacter koreensis]|uniref:Uncharacterized protein n=1 Tax=Parapedobacter koreensis TaxID=332977 RepID=A0A1H7LN02_9SPHI|nr:hypothetical protein [Parapedobacter koreensis]SEL00108.1 hypothetical protein SAMN05421740_103210 [Parapedobacter koreensis]
MKDYIIQYFTTERQGAVFGFLLSLALLATAWLLWRYPAHSLQRGIAYALLAGGLFLAVATSITIVHNQKRIVQAKTTEVDDERALQRREISRMENVLKTAYIGGLTTFTLFALGGISLLLFAYSPRFKGLGIGLLLFGLMGIGMELFSMKTNRDYLNRIKSINLIN